MNFSIFNSDGTLGQAGTRPVVIAATARNASWSNGDDVIRQSIINQLAVARIDHSGVRVTHSGYDVYIEVEVIALAQHSGEQIRQMVQNTLSAAVYVISKWNALIGVPPGTYPLLQNVSARVVSDDDRTTSQTASPFTPAAQTGGSGPAAAILPNLGSGGDFLGNLGTSLGVSATVATLLVLGMVVLVAKK